MELTLLKMHGSKNTFYLLEVESLDNIPYIELTKWLCNQQNNGGADGLLLVLPSDIANAKMRVINADGSEASMCGNGLRCVARYICERDNIEEAEIETLKAVLKVSKVETMLPDIPTYSVEISPISLELDSLPMKYHGKKTIDNIILAEFSDSILFTAISVPNPHLIGIVEKYYIEHTSHQLLLARFLNNQSIYTPDGVNLSYTYPLSSNEIFVRTFERGVGFTNACGTAMTAAAYVAYRNQYVTESLVTVYNPGGFVKCSITNTEDKVDLKLIGNATYMQKVSVNYCSHNFSISYCQKLDEAILYDERIKESMEKLNFSTSY